MKLSQDAINNSNTPKKNSLRKTKFTNASAPEVEEGNQGKIVAIDMRAFELAKDAMTASNLLLQDARGQWDGT